MSLRKRTGFWILVLIVMVFVGGYFLGKGTQWFKFPWQKPEVKKPEEKPSTVLPQQVIIPKGLAEFEQRVMLAANKALPAVVNINTAKKVLVQPALPPPLFSDPFFRRFFWDQIPFSSPQEQIQTGLGSGVIVTQDGYILTNNHVIAGADLIRVSLMDKRTFDAKIVGTDPKTDLALLKISATDLPTLPLGDSSKLEVGQFVLAVGNPFGLSGTVTMGIVSAKGRANLRIADYEDFIQTDAAINPGNSGGALVNLDGELVGINTVIFSQSGGNVGIGFAIPSNMAKAIMYNLIEYGKVIRGWLGVQIEDRGGEGVLVRGVVPSSPAEKAGIKAGDVILSYRGEKIESSSELKILVGETPPGEKVEIKFRRQGEERVTFAEIAELKEEGMALPEKSATYRMGLEVSDLNRDLREQFGIPREIKGVVVVALEEGGRAQEAGIQIGDVILRANQTLVKNSQDLEKALEEAGEDQIVLWVWRLSRTITLIIPPRE